jgi:outer membrane protein insertion porin family/translocation and assembly module TamA
MALAALLLASSAARAVPFESLDTHRALRLGSVRFEGNEAVGASALREALLTRPRRWFALWQERPPFDAHTFRTDLERLRALYRSRGYYHAVITEDVSIRDGDLVDVTITIQEGMPVLVMEVELVIDGLTLPPDDERRLRTDLPLEPGDVFEEERYERGRSVLRGWFRQRGYARVAVEKKARVDVRDDTATVRYHVEPGPPCVFGDVTISGLTEVEPEVVRREVAFQPGEPFQQSLLDKTRKNLDDLRLFRSVRLVEDETGGERVDVDIALAEGERHEVRLGVGYETEEGVRGIAAWRDYNFRGGARQLGFTLRISQLFRTIAADFLQPHFPTQTSRLRLIFLQEQTDDDPYDLLETKGLPRLEWDVTPHLTTYAFYRAALDIMTGVPPAVRLALPGADPKTSVVSGFGFGLDLNGTDSLLNPTRGGIARFSIEPVGMALGGDVSLVRAIWEGRLYAPLPYRFGAAGRMRLGSQEPTGSSTQIPLFERFYAGGINSVRGYARRRVGPLASDLVPPSKCTFLDCDHPLGGRSVVELSTEFRHPVTNAIDIAGFVDGGQVSLDSWDFPFDNLQYGVGLGVRYRSVIGPLRVDLGFPLDRRGDDASWQIYFAVGETF